MLEQKPVEERKCEHDCLLGCSVARVLLIALMMEAASASETSVNFYQTTRRNNPGESHLHTRRRENLKSQEKVCTS
jgi:hypothetical protein